jgi:type IV pilus assembly protein PilM
MNDRLVAFDIGESQVQLVYYANKQVKKAVCAALPDNLVLNGEILSMDAMADFLKETAKKNDIPRANAAVIIPESLVFTRNVSVPLMTEAQLVYNLPYEFKDYLTHEKNDYFFDYAVQERVAVEEDEDYSQDLSSSQNSHVQGNEYEPAQTKSSFKPLQIGKSSQRNAGQQEQQEQQEHGKHAQAEELKLFACATLKETIAQYRNMFNRAGFKLKVAIPEEAAYAALLRSRIEHGVHETVEDTCFVDVGFSCVRMQFYKGDSFYSRRIINLGMRDLVRSIADVHNVDEHMAYEYLITNYEDVVNEQTSVEVYQRMAVEIMKAVNFYNYNNRDQMLNCLYLCGGGSEILPLQNEIDGHIDAEIRSAVELLPESARVDNAIMFVKALGCAMQE